MTQIINLEHDYGYEETKASHRGKWPKEGDWDILYSVKDEDTSIFKPGNTLVSSNPNSFFCKFLSRYSNLDFELSFSKYFSFGLPVCLLSSSAIS